MKRIYLIPLLLFSTLLMLASDVVYAQTTTNDMTFTTLRPPSSGRTWQTDDVRIEYEEGSGTLIVTGYFATSNPDPENPTQEMTLKFRDYQGDGLYQFNGGGATWEDRNSGSGICRYLNGDGGNIKEVIDSTSVSGEYLSVLEGDFKFRCESSPRVGDPFTTNVEGTFRVEVGYKVTSPTEEDVVKPGEEISITWETIAAGSVDLYYSLEDPASDPEKYEIKKGVSANLGEYTWKVADTMSPQAWIVLVNPSFPDRHSKSEAFKIRGPQFAKIAYDAEGSCPECPYYLTFTPEVHGWSVENGDASTFSPLGRSDASRFRYGTATDPFTGMRYPDYFTKRPISAQRNRYPEWPNTVPVFGERVFYGVTASGRAAPIDRMTRVWAFHAENYGGSCYALAALAGMAFIDPEGTLAAYPEIGSLSNAKRINTATIDNDLADLISQVFALQLGVFEINRRLRLNPGPNAVLERLKEYLAADDVSTLMSGTNVLCLAGGTGDNAGAHAVNAYRITEDEDAGTAKIHVYDNNYPNEERVVSIDVNANTWSYAPQGWSGTGGIWLAMPFEKYSEQHRLYTENYDGERIALAQAGMGIEGEGAGGAFSYATEEGFSTTDEEVLPLFRLQGPGAPVSYLIPTGYESLTLIAELDEGVSTMLIEGESFVSFWSDVAAGDESQLIWEEESLTVVNPQESAQNVNVDALFEKEGIGRTLGVGELALQGGDSIRIEISEDEETLEVTNLGADTRYDVVVRQTGAEGHLEGGYLPVDIRKGETHLIQPRWDSLAADLPIYVSDGSGMADSIILDNLLMSVEDGWDLALTSFSVQNPLAAEGEVTVTLRTDAEVVVRANDMRGLSLGELYRGVLPSGTTTLPVDLSTFPGGAYIVTFEVDGRREGSTTVLKSD